MSSKRKRAKRSSPAPGTGPAAGATVAKLGKNVRRAEPISIVVAAVAMIWWTWMTWPDVLIDFGREIYIAWRLAEGETLYADIAYYFGPLSPYLNSLWIRLFGEHILALAIGNLMVWTAILLVLYRLLRAVADRFAATVACLVFILLFSFSQYVAIGNYNYVCPYSHEAVHGLALSLAALLCWSTFVKRGRLRFVAVGGLLWGMSFLTRLEPFAATGAGLAVGLAAYFVVVKPSGRRLATIALVLTASASIPILLSLALLTTAMPVAEAARGSFASVLSVVSSDVTSLKFFQDGLGLTNPGESLLSMLRWSGGYFGVFTVAVGTSLLIRRGTPVVRWTVSVLVSLVVGTVLWHVVSPSNETTLLPGVFRPLPVVIFALGAAAAVQLWRMRKQADACRCYLLILPLITFAALMLGKMLLNPRIAHYGFTLAMPATLLVVVALLDWIPRALHNRAAFGGGFRLTSLVVIAVVVVAHLRVVAISVAAKPTVLGTGGNAFRADRRGGPVGEALKLLEDRIKPEETLAVFPGGVMLNFLSGRVNPTPYTDYGPTELSIFGEDNMLASLQSNPPDFVLLVHKDTSEYGFRFFGQDYGRKIGTWITVEYRSVQVIGAPPLQDRRFGIMLMERKDRKGP